MTIHNQKSYTKLEPTSRKCVDTAINRLENRYNVYKNINKDVVPELLRDDVLVHDVVREKFYIYRCRVKDIQIRLLYEVNGNNKINVIDYCIKNRENLVKGKGKGRCKATYNQGYVIDFENKVDALLERRRAS